MSEDKNKAWLVICPDGGKDVVMAEAFAVNEQGYLSFAGHGIDPSACYVPGQCLRVVLAEALK